MYTLERTEENSGCALTRTDDARQAWDTRGDRVHRILGRTPFAINGGRSRNGCVLSWCKNLELSLRPTKNMYTLERTEENSGCAVTKTDDARQPRDTRGIGYIGFSEEHHLLLTEEKLKWMRFILV
ncbi:hypothetical protein CDAR_93071 [Caerostris darwini]|uniref:Uncharacterized protein n=1 Tax=Caerostris darwini TaxID=1538125 RepID=A0AAV4WHF8_9ARAC|nr:hypothetical protein CDAR_93071 [Caerostris darwini]